MAKRIDWSELTLTDEVTLVLGFRPRPGSKELVAGRVDVTRRLQAGLASGASRWLLDLRTRAPIRYEPDPHLEPEEYLATSLPELNRVASMENVTPHDDQGSELLAVLSSAFDSDDWFTADELRRTFLFYAVVVRLADGGSVAFVKQTSPQRVAKAGGWLTAFGDTLEEITRPVFVLEPDVDLVVHGDQIAVLRLLAFERLFADLELSRELIPVHVEALTSAGEWADDMRVRLERVGQRSRPRRLLRELSAFTPEQWAARTDENIRKVLEMRNLDPNDFFDDAGLIDTTEAHVETLLDVLASRYYTSDFDEEQMRADKVRRRS